MKMTENRSCDTSDFQSSEMPLKKRKDSRLCNSSSSSSLWRIESSHTGNPLKKRFFRSPCGENESLPKTSVNNKNVSSNEEKGIFSILSSYQKNAGKPMFSYHSSDVESCFSQRTCKPSKPVKEEDNDLEGVKINFGRDAAPNYINKQSQFHTPYDMLDLSNKKMNHNSSTVIPGVFDLSCKNNSLNSRIHAQHTEELVNAVCSGLPETSNLLGASSDIKNPAETVRCKKEFDLSDNTLHAHECSIEKSMPHLRSPLGLSQDKDFPPSRPDYVKSIWNFEFNGSPPLSYPLKMELLQENQPSSPEFFEKLMPLSIQLAENALSRNKDSAHCYLTNPKLEAISEMKTENNFSRVSSSFDNISVHSNSFIPYSDLFKTAFPQHHKLTELRGENETHDSGDGISRESKKNFVATNAGPSNSYTDFTCSSTLLSPLLSQSNEDTVHDASNFQEKHSYIGARFLRCTDNISNSEDTHSLYMNYLKYRKNTSDENSKNHMIQFHIAKDTEENIAIQKILNDEMKMQQNLLNQKDKESKNELKDSPQYIFPENVEEKGTDGKINKTFYEICKAQLESPVTRISVKENIPEKEILLNNYRQNHERDIKDELESFLSFSSPKIREICEEAESSSKEIVGKTHNPMNEMLSKPPESNIIDLCSNNDKRSMDDHDEDVKVIEVYKIPNFKDLKASSTHPSSSKMPTGTEQNSFQSSFETGPSTSKCHSKYDFASFPLDMSNPVHKKYVEPTQVSTFSRSHQDKSKESKSSFDSFLLSPNDDYVSVSSPESVISISSSSSPSSSPCRDNNQQIDCSLEDEIFGSLIRVMDYNQRKRPSVLKKTGKSKQIPVLTILEDESSDEEVNSRHKKPKLSEKGDSSPTCNKSKQELECAICLEIMNSKRGTSATTCGHVYCTPCISEVIEKKGECPTCRKALDSTQVHKLFLFA